MRNCLNGRGNCTTLAQCQAGCRVSSLQASAENQFNASRYNAGSLFAGPLIPAPNAERTQKLAADLNASIAALIEAGWKVRVSAKGVDYGAAPITLLMEWEG